MWLPGFDHEVIGGNATDYLAPFRTATGLLPNFGFLPQPAAGFPAWEWGWPVLGGKFNAIHMSLIPKGPLQGRLLVWNRYPVILRPGSPLDGTNYWAFQAYSILDPRPNAPAPRFRNFLLPLVTVNTSTLPSTLNAADLFCAGHAWSPFGDLVVAGGAEFDFQFGTPLSISEPAGSFLFLFDPSNSSAPFPGQSTPLYSGALGRWQAPPGGLQLSVARYYPTVTLTHSLNRFQPILQETMVVAGGRQAVPPSVFDPRNTFESFRVRPAGAPNFLAPDSVAGQLVFSGPGISSSPYRDWLEQYPRLHLLSTGRLFLSGWAPLSASFDPENPPTAAAQWDRSIGGSGSPGGWNLARIDGSSVFFSRLGPFQDLVLRFCGEGVPLGGNVTRTAELCFASTPTDQWNALQNVPDESPAPGGRKHTNAVILPDASVLLLGGENPAFGPILTMGILKPGQAWTTPFGASGTPSVRDYHATMVLLPDGRVFVGGGEGRHSVTAGTPSPHDYDIYEPAYLHSSSPRPTAVALPGTGQDPDGTYILNRGQLQIPLTCTLYSGAAFEGLDYVDKIVLMAPGSITHHSDMSARYIELASVAVNSLERRFDVPSQTVAPRGYYMLFAVTNAGIPAEAIWVRIQ